MTALEQRLRDALAAQATALPDPQWTVQPTRRRVSSRAIAIAIAVAVLALGTVAATWILTRDVTNPTGVGCFDRVATNGDIAVAGMAGDLSPDLCAEFWKDGTLVNESIVPAGQVPPLTGCVTEAGVLWVFPSDDSAVCEQLGLSTPAPNIGVGNNDIRSLGDTLVDDIAWDSCVPIDEAKEQVRAILDERGFTDWVIKTGPLRPGSICASLAVDAPLKTIRLVPIPDIWSDSP